MSDGNSSKARLLRRLGTQYQALPPLDSDEFRDRLLSAPRDDLRAQNLIRAYVELGGVGPNAELLLRRLLDAWLPGDGHGPYVQEYVARGKGYLQYVRILAETRLRDTPSPYPIKEYVRQTGRQIYNNLLTECQKAQETGEPCQITAWIQYLRHRFADAVDALEGKQNETDGERPKVAKLRALPDAETGRPLVEADHLAVASGDGASWHVSAGPSIADFEGEDLLRFLRSELRRGQDPLALAVAEHLWFSDDPPPISKSVADIRRPLTEILGVSRHQITRAAGRARGLLKAAVLDEFGSGSDEFRFVQRLPAPTQTTHHVRISR